jgi:plasmid stability protein
MATLYVRDVPERLYKRLRARARRNGRSLNAEVLAVLDDTVVREKDAAEITARMREIATRVRRVPGMPTPEQLIRWDRDHGHD